ncbi:MAG: LPS export ABC transporter periplasmic protein LptC [Ghiorsea sp.]
MLTAKHSIQEVLDAVAVQAGSTISNPDIKAYEGDDLSWRLQATSAHEQGDLLLLENPVVDLFTKKGERIPIQAKAGEYDKEKGYIHLQGNVEAGYQSWVLKSEALDFYKLVDEIHIVNHFTLRQEGMDISGKNMKVMRALEKVSVSEGVHMVLEEKE